MVCVIILFFDTKTTEYGGSGVKFDWNLITAYHGETPFLSEWWNIAGRC